MSDSILILDDNLLYFIYFLVMSNTKLNYLIPVSINRLGIINLYLNTSTSKYNHPTEQIARYYADLSDFWYIASCCISDSINDPEIPSTIRHTRTCNITIVNIGLLKYTPSILIHNIQIHQLKGVNYLESLL